MLSIRKPDPSQLRDFLKQQADLDLTYTEVGATLASPPPGYAIQHVRTQIGEGQEAFETACDALRHWEPFRLGWVDAWTAEPRMKPGGCVAIVGRSFGLWWRNACRIVAVIEETKPIRRFGFAFGTLPSHIQSGEERLTVEWDAETGTVWFELFSFSRPKWLPFRWGQFWIRRAQRRFGLAAAEKMRKLVSRADCGCSTGFAHSEQACR